MRDYGTDWDEVKLRLAKLKSTQEAAPVFRWGVVTGIDPLRVRLDASESELDGTPSAVIGGYEVGDRVLCLIQNRRATLVSRSKEARRFTIGNYGSTTAEPSVILRRTYNGTDRYFKAYVAAHGSAPEVGLQVGAPNAAGNDTQHVTMYLTNDGNLRVNTHAGSPTASASRPVAFAMAVGSVGGSNVVAAGAELVTVTFPSKRFTTTPAVFAIPVGGSNIRDVNTTVVSRTSSQAVIRKGSVSAVTRNFGFFWQAVQMTPTSME